MNSSGESDDEPLAAIAAAKKDKDYHESDEFVDHESDDDYQPSSRKRKKKKPKIVIKKKASVTISLAPKPKPKEVVQRPEDVWLYLKDLNPVGPYSCLLCPKLFVSKLRVMGHYMLDHKKYYCGLCRYIVIDEGVEDHFSFHIPYPCTQCDLNFQSSIELKHHLSVVHNLVSCRVCNFMLPNDEQYVTHLQRKHNVVHIDARDYEILWAIYSDKKQFSCLLCTKPKYGFSYFFNHFTGYHHFTLKCFSTLIYDQDIPFTVAGVNVTEDFMYRFQYQGKCGYAELDKNKYQHKLEPDTNDEIAARALFVEVKHEVLSENDDPEENKPAEEDDDKMKEIKSYEGETDFDITLTELVLLQTCYYDYVTESFPKARALALNSDVNYSVSKQLFEGDLTCCICPITTTTYKDMDELVQHISKMHSVKIVPDFVCRLCVATFDTLTELEDHLTNELGDFKDLWLCQFCDKEFDGRVPTRNHLSEHWEEMNSENCFSPQLGFKCKFCPMLFWNEPEREEHQVKSHVEKNTEQFYKCECGTVFGDKVWFTYHYFDKHYEENSKRFYLLKCSLCAVVLQNVDEMRSHFKTNHPVSKKVYCSLDPCQFKPLSHKKSFKLHLRTKHVGIKRQEHPTNCSICGEHFPNAKTRNAHMADVHSTGKFKCKLCPEALLSLDERKLHYLLRHPGHHPFECKDCGKSFQYKSSLYMHRREHQLQPDFSCHVCHKTFSKKDSFREHLMIHEGPQHSCSYCPRRFVQRSNMLRHERRHTGERPYSCTHCDKTFADKGACSAHIKHHHRPRESHPCPYCSQTFVQKTKLNYHLRKHTGENLETCSLCSKIFTSRCSLREHMKNHARKNEALVPCPMCKKKYHGTEGLMRHVRSTHARDSFICPICKKALTSPFGLREHVVTHANKPVFWCKLCPKSYAVRRTIGRHLRDWHGMRNPTINIKEFFRTVDPRDLNLNLDEEVITAIFGPRKETESLPSADFMAFVNTQGLKNTNQAPPAEEFSDREEEEANSGEESEIEEKYRPPELEAENSQNTEGDQAFEPTDFVTIKIEPELD